jgi:hypothetical protein
LVLMLYFTPGETKEWEEQKVSKASWLPYFSREKRIDTVSLFIFIIRKIG